MKKGIFLTISIIGILFLLFLSCTIEPKEIEINKIDKKYINKKIQTKGRVIKIKNYKNDFQIFTIQNNKTIDVLTKPINLSKNQTVLVKGKVNLYKEKLQILADEIKITE